MPAFQKTAHALNRAMRAVIDAIRSFWRVQHLAAQEALDREIDLYMPRQEPETERKS